MQLTFTPHYFTTNTSSKNKLTHYNCLRISSGKQIRYSLSSPNTLTTTASCTHRRNLPSPGGSAAKGTSPGTERRKIWPTWW